MPKDISSSSSSEDEAENPAATEPTEPNKKTRKYECPQDFVSFCHVPCSSSLSDNLRNGENELWLIKAPASFSAERFRGVKVPLSGLQTLKVPSPAATGGGQQIYSVLASSLCSSELWLLTSDSRASGGATFGPAFSGLLNICESYGDSSTNQAPRVIPAAPAPSIPPGLKQRFHPFGSKTPTLTYVAESEADGAAFGPSSTTLRPRVVKRFLEEAGPEAEDNDEEDARKKKKKKKKEKRTKSEQMEEVLKVKQEPVDLFQEVEKMKKKKKKKKKDREQEEVEEEEEGLEPSVKVKVEEVSVKCEPVDVYYGDAAESQGKKKKKKKKSKPDED
ncbi:CD3e molecule, epsilon associated protein [Kryptolebias marmoratus]|uniref:RNA polymerase I subunit G n=1 Tax=Kryptolebias marmoratus TaxID=37003 RepID=A0A3Q3G883_KRYMA|nr:CD3e molecule, epsilon associated protein [Kryptolebias marmoratus]